MILTDLALVFSDAELETHSHAVQAFEETIRALQLLVDVDDAADALDQTALAIAHLAEGLNDLPDAPPALFIAHGWLQFAHGAIARQASRELIVQHLDLATALVSVGALTKEGTEMHLTEKHIALLTLDTDDDPAKAEALAKFLGVQPGDIETIHRTGRGASTTYVCAKPPGEWLVLTDEEAEKVWDAHLDHHIEAEILSAMSQEAADRFDRDAFKREAKENGDGRSYALSNDGSEYKATIRGEQYYIYRLN